jgi:hypothetical protein
MSDFVLGDEIEKHEGQLEGMTKALTEGKREDFVAEAASLVVSVATEVPVLGSLMKPVVARAFATSANAVLEKQIAEWRQELDRTDLVQRVAEAIEVLLGQALIQIVRAQHGASEKIIDELGGLRDDLAGFREDFAKRIAATSAEVHVEQELVSGGATGVRVRASSSKAVRIVQRTVTGHGTTGVEIG